MNEGGLRLKADDTLEPTSESDKVRSNLDALTLLKRLESEGRNPTPEEQRTLAKYVGWGFYKEVFNDLRRERGDESWRKKYGRTNQQLRDLLTPEEYESAKGSTINAHYTELPIAAKLWELAERLGFRKGNVVDFGAGKGTFFGTMPEHLRRESYLTGVELDDVTARILAKLFPEAKIMQGALERARIPHNSADLVIGNFPFSEVTTHNPDHPDERLNLHNTAFRKALDTVRPGGLVIAITSQSTLDNNPVQRRVLMEAGELVGAIRLPNNAFKKVAGTEVTTDVLIFRKPDGSGFRGESFTETPEDADGIKYNEYFHNHPEMALGRHAYEGSMYRGNEYALVPTRGDLIDKLSEAIQKMPADVMGRTDTATTGPIRIADATEKEDSYVLRDGKLQQVKGGALKEPDYYRAFHTADDQPRKNPPKREVLDAIARRYVAVRDAATRVINLELANDEDTLALDQARAELNRAYDDYVANHGSFNNEVGQRRASDFLADDQEHSLVMSLEDPVEVPVTLKRKSFRKAKRETEVQYVKSAIFKGRVIPLKTMPESAKGMDEAINLSLGFHGRLDPAVIGKLMGMSEDVATDELRRSDRVFEDPETGLLETREKYLSGNVRQKLYRAEKMAEDDQGRWQRNVDALKAIQPEKISLPNIHVNMGANWIPADAYARFFSEIFQTPVRVQYSRETGEYALQAENSTEQIRSTYGTDRIAGDTLANMIIKGKKPEIYTTDENDKRTFDSAATAVAQERADKMADEFRQWVKNGKATLEDGRPVSDALEDAYNQQMNGHVAAVYDGHWLKLPGLSESVKPYKHQLSVVARNLQEGCGVIAHGVGFGKTYELIISAMEAKRTGLFRKPMIAVQKATVGQFAASFRKAYPAAKILVADEHTFSKRNRQRFFSNIATRDWDAVILTHPQFDRIESDPKVMSDYYRSLISELEDVMAAKAQDDDDISVRQLEKAKDRMEQRLHALADRLQDRQDDTIYFEKMGVDSMYIDEAHVYKSIPIITNKTRVKGIPTSSSQRALNLESKARHIQALNRGRGVFLASGTPVTNTMAEAYVMLRLATPHILKSYDLPTFDQWAAAFGVEEPKMEYTWSGAWKYVSRFSRFVNGPELITMIRSAFDVQMGKELLKVPKLKGDAVEFVKVGNTPPMDRVRDMITEVAAAWDQAEPKERKLNSWVPIVTMGYGTAAALDPRLVDPSAADHPGSKVNTAVKNILQDYQESNERKGTQLVFADRFLPLNTDKLMEFAGFGHREATKEAEPLVDTTERPEDEVDDPNDEKAAAARDKAETDAYKAAKWTLYADIRDKLIAGGIPEKEIAIIHDYSTDKQRQKLFEDVNAGKIRVLMGSTEKLGVGVNVQQRLYSAHLLDPPRSMTPAMREQRIGRIVRQGNKHGPDEWNIPVRVREYGVELSMDTGIYQMLERKQKFLVQLLTGNAMSREFDDPSDEVVMGMAQMVAQLSGDNRAIRMAELTQKVRELETRRWGFVNEQGSRARELRYQESRLRQAQDEQREYARKSAETAKQIDGKNWRLDWKDKTDQDRDSIVTDIDSKLQTMSDTLVDKFMADLKLVDGKLPESLKAPEASPHDASFRAKLNGYELAVKSSSGRRVVVQDGRPLPPEIETHYALHDGETLVASGRITGGRGLLQSIQSVPERLKTRSDEARDMQPGIQKSIAELTRLQNDSWPHEEELSKLRAELADVQASLTGTGSVGKGKLAPWRNLDKEAIGRAPLRVRLEQQLATAETTLSDAEAAEEAAKEQIFKETGRRKSWVDESDATAAAQTRVDNLKRRLQVVDKALYDAAMENMQGIPAGKTPSKREGVFYRTGAQPEPPRLIADAAAKRIIFRILGPHADVSIVDRIFEEGADRLGKYQAGLSTIARRGDMERTAFHEAYHGAEDMLFTDAERARAVEIEPDAERRADAFMEYAKRNAGFTGRLRGLFARLMFRIKSLFGTAGKLDELRAVHARLMAGEMAGRRPVNGRTMYGQIGEENNNERNGTQKQNGDRNAEVTNRNRKEWDAILSGGRLQRRRKLERPQYRTEPQTPEETRLANLFDVIEGARAKGADAANTANASKLAALKAKMAAQAQKRAEAVRAGQNATIDQARTKAGLKPVAPATTDRGVVSNAVATGEQKATRTVAEMLNDAGDSGKAVNAAAEGRMSIRAAANRLVNANLSQQRDIRRSLIKVMKEAIPDASVRGTLSRKILKALISRKATPDTIQGALRHVDEIMDAQERKGLIGAIKAIYDHAANSMGINVHYRQRIRALMDDFLLSKPTAATMDKARELRDFLNAESGSGMDLTLNRRMAGLLDKLSKVPLSELDTNQLRDLYAEIHELATRGKLYQEGKRQQELDRLDADAADILSGPLTKLDDPIREMGVIGEPPTWGQKFRSMMQTASDGMGKWYRWHLPIDALFDLMSGYQHYKGSISRIFKGRPDVAFKEFRQALAPVELELKDVLKRHKIGKRESIRIGVYGIDQQTMDGDKTYGRKKLYNSFGAETDAQKAEIDRQVDAIELTPDEKAVYDWMLAKFQDVAPALQRTANEVYNVEFEKVHKYWPMQTDWEITENDPIAGYEFDEFGGIKRKNPEKGFIKARTGAGTQRIQIDSARAFLKHMSDAHYMIHMAPVTKYLAELARRPDVAAGIGKEGQRTLLEYIDTMARKGGVAGDHVIRWADTLRRNVGVGTLGFRLSSFLIQPSSFINALGTLGPRGFKGAMDIMMPGRLKWVLDNSREIRDRVGDDPSFVEWGGGRVRQKITNAGYWPLEQLDRLTAAAVFHAAYEADLRKRGIRPDYEGPADKQAVEAAELVVRRTQASGNYKDAPMAVTRGKLLKSHSLSRMLYQFQTFTMNTFSYVAHDGLGNALHNKEWGKAANMALWATMAFLAEESIRAGLAAATGDDRDRDLKKEVGWDFIGTVPIFGQLAGALRYGSVPVPMIAAGSEFTKGVGSALMGATPEARERGAVRAAGSGLTLAGVPGSSQASQWIRRGITTPAEDVKALIDDSAKRLPKTAGAGRLRLEAQIAYNKAKAKGIVDPRKTTAAEFRTHYLARFKALNKE